MNRDVISISRYVNISSRRIAGEPSRLQRKAVICTREDRRKNRSSERNQTAHICLTGISKSQKGREQRENLGMLSHPPHFGVSPDLTRRDPRSAALEVLPSPVLRTPYNNRHLSPRVANVFTGSLDGTPRLSSDYAPRTSLSAWYPLGPRDDGCDLTLVRLRARTVQGTDPPSDISPLLYSVFRTVGSADSLGHDGSIGRVSYSAMAIFHR